MSSTRRRRQLGDVLLVLACLVFQLADAFVPSQQPQRHDCVILSSTQSPRSDSSASAAEKKKKKEKKEITLKDLRGEIQKNPSAFLGEKGGNNSNGKKSSYRRSRKRAENPQQQYLYAKQRKQLEREGKLPQNKLESEDNEGSEASSVPAAAAVQTTTSNSFSEQVPAVTLAKEYGLIQPAAQHCDALVDDMDPVILGQIRVGDELKSGSYAYIINKPAGWAILGGGGGKKTTIGSTILQSQSQSPQANGNDEQDDNEITPTKKSSSSHKEQITRLEIKDVDGSRDVLEFSEADLLAVMTPEEIEEYKAEMGSQPTATSVEKVITKKVQVRVDDDDEDDELFLDDFELEELEQQELELLSQLTPEELEEYVREVGPLPENFRRSDSMTNDNEEETKEASVLKESATDEPDLVQSTNSNKEIDPKTAEVLTKIEARKSAAKSSTASFASYSRPSVVAWLKDLKAREGNPMKGGKYWTALAGATDVDDSGIVILCPKEYTDNVFVDYLEYVAVIGNNDHLAPKPKGVESISKAEMTIETLSNLKRARREDIVQTVKVMVPEKFSSCSSIVQACQKQFQDGIRGDPAANPLNRLANRRLLHCNAVSVSSLLVDESKEVETEGVPDDIAILAERRNQHQYQEGSFLGRSALRKNPLTTAYREINGAADGFPGWTVDRYNQWLFVQHDEKMPRGPLPSIHDGNTAGVYYLPANQDRSAMGSGASSGVDSSVTRPRLLEGQPAPDTMEILENGVTYLVSLDKNLSTGIFLDQRPQRAWMTRNCNEDTHVLNCFAHCGGFSIAAATAGASTTSVDLSKKWLDRVEPQLAANGVEFDIRHDCIYGDCFEWLAKLAKRGEKYDIVILDPPSASVGGKKKKRWSIKNDMPELVTLASKVVKKGGLLWTTTNSASVTPVKFARLCRRGLEDAGLGSSAKLERIQPMPHDFPSIGPQPVKNLVWRLH